MSKPEITDPAPGVELAPRKRMRAAPPAWLPAALGMTAVAAFIGLFAWEALGKLGNVFTILVISFFLALAMEPPVVWLVRKGMKRGAAAGVVMLSLFVSTIGLFALFGQMFFTQAVNLFKDIPELYTKVQDLALRYFDYTIPDSDEVVQQAIERWGSDAAGSILGISGTVLGGLFTLSAVLLVVFYMVTSGPKLKVAVCQWLPAARQQEVLGLWGVAQQKVADFLISRIILALICTAATAIFLFAVQVPYALPLALFAGLVSQFVPTVGTYIGGALPVLVAFTVSPLTALLTIGFIVAYQQLENLLVAPKISEKSMALNPAVAFISVMAFAAVFGALGAILSLPVVATIQAVIGTYINRHDLVESNLLSDEQYNRPTKIKKFKDVSQEEARGKAPAPPVEP